MENLTNETPKETETSESSSFFSIIEEVINNYESESDVLWKKLMKYLPDLMDKYIEKEFSQEKILKMLQEKSNTEAHDYTISLTWEGLMEVSKHTIYRFHFLGAHFGVRKDKMEYQEMKQLLEQLYHFQSGESASDSFYEICQESKRFTELKKFLTEKEYTVKVKCLPIGTALMIKG